ncbi:extracellular solute-binding protein [Roseibium hamelinense]|nr:extracellular solute-binding protein [Roseibium hamelinense]
MKFLVPLVACFGATFAQAAEPINVFTWDGYVQPEEVSAVNALLKEQGYDYEIKLLETPAEGPEQMFNMLRSGKVDISFLTLNYITMESAFSAQLLQPIDTSSPRLGNYQFLNKSLTNIPMGMQGNDVLYVPWGGGAYGIWADKDKVSDLPKSVNDLFDPKWTGKLSLSKGQIEPNIAIALLALDKPPFHINDISGDRATLAAASAADGEIQQKLTQLYGQVAAFWEAGPEFSDDLLLVASYGPGAAAHNAAGGNWELVQFDEGNTVWLDTINFSKGLSGKKLEAAEIFANYFIGKEVQDRVVNGLGMVAASSLAGSNPLIEQNPDFFAEAMFWPPYTKTASNVMQKLSKAAMK